MVQAEPGLPGGIFRGSPTPRRFHLPVGPSRASFAPARRLRRPRTAFVLAGGGSRGAAQVGMLAALVERGIRADAVYGASAGAMNGAAYAGRPDAAGVEHLDAIWRGISSDDVFPRGRLATPWRFFQQREAVHPNDGLRRIVESGLAFERLEDAAVHLEVVATSLEDGRVQWFDSGEAVPRILASAALPALLPPVTIDGERFIDGGVVDNVPLRRAIDQGAQRVFVLLCGPLRFRPPPYARPVEAIMTAFFIAIHAGFARELTQLPPGVEVIVISVDGHPGSGYDDFSGTGSLISTGRTNALAVLDAWEASKAPKAPKAGTAGRTSSLALGG